MTDAIRPLIAGNWKMNGLKASIAEFEAMCAGAHRLEFGDGSLEAVHFPVAGNQRPDGVGHG